MEVGCGSGVIGFSSKAGMIASADRDGDCPGKWVASDNLLHRSILPSRNETNGIDKTNTGKEFSQH